MHAAGKQVWVVSRLITTIGPDVPYGHPNKGRGPRDIVVEDSGSVESLCMLVAGEDEALVGSLS
jgi:hypothetical protein